MCHACTACTSYTRWLCVWSVDEATHTPAVGPLSLQQIAIDISALRGRLHPLRHAAARAERGDEDRAFARGHRHARVSHVAAEEQRGACGWSQHGRRSLDAMAERVLRPEAGAWVVESGGIGGLGGRSRTRIQRLGTRAVRLGAVPLSYGGV